MDSDLGRDSDLERRKRARYRSWHRGTREMDFLLGRFADRHLAQMDDEALTRYEALLEVADPLLYRWIAGGEPVPETVDGPLIGLLRNFQIDY
jgi:antitoxin CptB